ncbi:MAG: hypothetical protein CM15mP103_12940 [Gammaproteobacteria bacterium]|nr:MAG: hypothetical protein CM15mP103_12940 [Gammaproteobacteria bacterium]
MLGLEGVPAFYIHSCWVPVMTSDVWLTPAITGRSTGISGSWARCRAPLDCNASDHHASFEALKHLIALRKGAASIPPQRNPIHPALG